MERIRKEKAAIEAPPKFLIYFVDRDVLRWWDYIFTQPGFRHCFVLKWDHWANRWLLIDWRRHDLDMMILFDFEVRAIFEECGKAKMTCVRYSPDDVKYRKTPFLLSYCSNLIGKLLGLDANVILTPHQLYRKLIAAGGEIVFDWRTQDEENPDSDPRATPTGSLTDRENPRIAG